MPQPRRPGVKEAHVLKAICHWLNLEGIWYRRLQTQGVVLVENGKTRMRPNACAGMPDLLLCLDGRLVAIEVKAPTGKTTPTQDRVLAELANAGAAVQVVRSLDDAQRFLDAVRAEAEFDRRAQSM